MGLVSFVSLKYDTVASVTSVCRVFQVCLGCVGCLSLECLKCLVSLPKNGEIALCLATNGSISKFSIGWY